MCSQPKHGLPTCPEPKNNQVPDYYSVLHYTSLADDQSVRVKLKNTATDFILKPSYTLHTTGQCTLCVNACNSWFVLYGDYLTLHKHNS